MKNKTLPSPLISLIPIAVLVAMLAVTIYLFGSDALGGGSQVCLLAASGVCVLIGMAGFQRKWKHFEKAITHNITGIATALLILLIIGALSGAWMVSGVVPTLIYYGIQIIHPSFFLVSTCLICCIVSVMTGSSWTTIATIGVALIGIGQGQGIPTPWIAGAIISGAYFGDKMSPLSDTTILASSATRTDLFVHIRYMLYTTIPTFIITSVIFLVAGFFTGRNSDVQVEQYTQGLSSTFNISLWTLIVPILTGVLIVRRAPSAIILFSSALMAGAVALILQPHLLAQIAGSEQLNSPAAMIRGLAVTYYGSTAIETGDASLNDLVSTGGMAGMLDTIWLVLCAMCFGSVMVASGMIESLTRVIIRFARTRFSLVGATTCTGIFLNLTTGDQFISIVLTADMYRDAYRKQGYESRLLSRTTEDVATVTSVLIPWNTCGMTQAAVLGVPTLVYLPYSFFNLISPFMTLLVAAIGWKIKKTPGNEAPDCKNS